MNISFVIVSFKSFHLIEKHIQSIPSESEIIIIENSLDMDVKKKFEKLYSNVQVIIPKNNLGYGKGLNLGLQKAKNNFVMCMVSDIKIEKECIIEISNILKEFNDFSIISPTYVNENIHKNYTIKKNDNLLQENKNILKYSLKEVDEIDGAILILNKEKFKTNEILDEKIFLYFENVDLCFRVKKSKEKMYIIENLKFEHFGLQSSHKKYQNEVLKSRNWHYCWSKFYFYRKHYSYLKALQKTLPNLIRSIRLCIYYKIKKDEENFELHKYEILGLINAYALRSSFYRPNIS